MNDINPAARIAPRDAQPRESAFPEPSVVMVAGDWHGNAPWAVRCINHAADRGADAIIQVGDFGFWTPGPQTGRFLDAVTRTAEARQVRVYWLDGNHEDFSRRDEFAQPHTDWVTYLPRGHRWQWWGKTWMAVGGAVSVDKMRRTPTMSWWPEEELTDADISHACRPGSVDIIVAHDCPTGVVIPGIGPITKNGDWPYHVLVDAEHHRAKCRTIWDTHQPELWLHGHYHVGYEFWLRETRFIGLGRDSDTMTNALAFLHPDGTVETR